jgi:hypothetical protein
MALKISKYELESITNFQNDMHYVSNDKEPMTSKFYKEYVKTTWYCTNSVALDSVIMNDEGDEIHRDYTKVKYTVDPHYHYLMYTSLRLVLPAIKVKPKFASRIRICWCHNIGTNITVLATFKDDDNHYQSWDPIAADDYYQFFQYEGAGKRRNHNIGIGNVPMLEEWTDALPTYPINVDQPWYYGEEPGVAFPIHMRNSQSRIEHHQVYRKKVSSLLRMQKLINGVWVNVETVDNMKYLLCDSLEINKPTLWSRYAYITDAEIRTNKCKQEMKQRTFYYKDFDICDGNHNKTYKYGETAEIDIKCTNPCVNVFWKAENMDATKYNNYSNYTCNTNDLYAGWDPLHLQSLKYGTTYKFKDMESDHFNIGESRKHTRSSPEEIGYHVLSNAYQSHNYHGEVGIVYGKDTKLICHFANKDIYALKTKSQVDDEDDDFDFTLPEPEMDTNTQSPNFKMRIRLMVIKKLTINRDDHGTYTFIVT